MSTLKFKDPADGLWKYVNTVASGDKAYIDAQDAITTPIGTIVAYGGTVAPTGWHLCDGTAHGSSALQAVIGSVNTPNLKDKFIVGAGATYADKATGGAATVTLTAAQSGTTAHGHGTSVATASANAAHSHGGSSVSGGAHTHVLNTGVWTSWNGVNNDGTMPGGNGSTFYPAGHAALATSSNGAHGHTINSDNAAHSHTFTPSTSTAAAASAAHENLPPYYALTYIIKKV